MLKQILIAISVIALLPLVLRLVVKTHLIVPILYVIVTALFFPEWATAHGALSFGILGILLMVVVLSWVLPVLARHREERMMEKALLLQIRAAREKEAGPLPVSIEAGIPIIRINQ